MKMNQQVNNTDNGAEGGSGGGGSIGSGLIMSLFTVGWLRENAVNPLFP